MDIQRDKRPVIIVGCTRSGTKLISRIIGGHPDNFLITEHREKFHISEDKSGVFEEQIWWNNFAYKHWSKKGKPQVRTPIYNEQDIAVVRDILLKTAGDRRIVIKNPQSILRVLFLKKMFPNAMFIFCVRNPWHGLQSRVIGGKLKYLLASQKNFELEQDLLLKSIYSWKESIDIYQEEHDENWHVVRYEDTVFNTRDTVKKVFDFLGMRSDPEYFEKAISLPRDLKHRFYPVKKAFKNNRFKKEIMDSINSGCKVFPYDASIDSVPGSAFQYYAFEKKIVNVKKIKSKLIKIAKKFIKKIIRAIFYLFGGSNKLRVNPLLFGALSQDINTFITQEDDKLKNVAVHSKKGDQVSFKVLQMQYYRLRNYKKVIVMDSKGKPWLMLKNIAFSHAHRYDYMLVGEIEYIKD